MYLGKIPIISTESFRQKQNNLLNRASYSLHAETIVSSLSRNFSPVKARSDKEKTAAIAAAVAGASIFPGTWDFPFSLSLSLFFLTCLRFYSTRNTYAASYLLTHTHFAVARYTLFVSFIIYRRRNSAHCFPKQCN